MYRLPSLALPAVVLTLLAGAAAVTARPVEMYDAPTMRSLAVDRLPSHRISYRESVF